MKACDHSEVIGEMFILQMAKYSFMIVHLKMFFLKTVWQTAFRITQKQTLTKI